MAGVWRTVKIGGGGYVTGIDKSTDETTIVCRSDTYGAYIWNSTVGEWEELFTKASMPSAFQEPGGWTGVTELRVAPNRPNRLYMMRNGRTLRSDNRGRNWIDLGLNWDPLYEDSGNTVPRFMGQKMAVDPINADVVYVGVPNNPVTFISQTGNFTVGQVLTGGTSGATATIVSQNDFGTSGTLQLQPTNALSFQVGEIITDPLGGSATTAVVSLKSGVWRSFNAGVTWAQISTSTIPACVTEFNGRNPGHPGICFDPTSGSTGGRTNTIYIPVFGSGIYRSTNAGSTWASISSPLPKVRHAKVDQSGNYWVCGIHAHSDGTVLNVTGAANNGSGAIRLTVASTANLVTSNKVVVANTVGTTEANGTWVITTIDGTHIDLQGSTFTHAWVSGGEITPYVSGLYKYNGSWTANLSSAGVASDAVDGVVIDPADANRVIAFGAKGEPTLSTDGGATFGSAIPFTRTSSAIPWLAYTNEDYLAMGDVIFVGSNEIWIAHGIGVAKCTFSGTPSSIVWDYITKGIENLTVRQALCPPNGSPVFASWDRAIHVSSNPETYPSFHYPDNKFRMAWDVDYATSDPTFLAICSTFGDVIGGSLDSRFGWKSTDGGATWAAFSSTTVGQTGTIPLQSGGSWIKVGGCIACASPTNIVVAMSNFSLPWYTKDGGATWTEIVISGVPTSGETGWGLTYAANHKIVAADRVAANTFYLFNYVTGKCYRSTDSGDNWTAMNSSSITTGVGIIATMKSVPGQQGHLFLIGGYQGNVGDANPGNTKMLRSTDGGATWAEISGFTIREPHAIGFGKAAAGQSYPSVAFSGWLDGVYGVWRSDDNCVSWSSLATFPNGMLGMLATLDGSKEVYGTWYAGVRDMSYLYRTEAMQYTKL